MHPLCSLKTFLPIYTSNDMYVLTPVYTFNLSCAQMTVEMMFLCNLLPNIVKRESSHCIPNLLRLNPMIMKSGPAPLTSTQQDKCAL